MFMFLRTMTRLKKIIEKLTELKMADMVANRCSNFSSGESALCNCSMHLRMRSRFFSEGGIIFDYVRKIIKI